MGRYLELRKIYTEDQISRFGQPLSRREYLEKSQGRPKTPRSLTSCEIKF